MSDALYAESGTQSVTTGAQIPLALASATSPTTLSLANNQVTLPAGTYLVSFGGTAYPATDTQFGVQLYANGVALPQQNLLIDRTEGQYGNLSKTFIYNTAGTATLAIYNSTPATANFTNAFITATKLQ